MAEQKHFVLSIGPRDAKVACNASFFAPIRNEPEVIELLKIYEEHIAEQRRLLQAMESQQAGQPRSRTGIRFPV